MRTRHTLIKMIKRGRRNLTENSTRIKRAGLALFSIAAASISRICSRMMAFAASFTCAIIGSATRGLAAFAAIKQVSRAIIVAIAITQTNATPSSSELSGLAEVARLTSLVETEGACALPGCTIKYESFVQVMWNAVQRGFVRHDEATFVADGLRYGFKLGVDTAKMRGHRQFNNYKSSIESAASVSKAIQERVDNHKTLDLGPSTPELELSIRKFFAASCIFPMGAVGKSVEEYIDEKRPTDDHARSGLNAATDMKGLRYSLDTYRRIAEGFLKNFYMRVSDVKGAFPILPLHPDAAAADDAHGTSGRVHRHRPSPTQFRERLLFIQGLRARRRGGDGCVTFSRVHRWRFRQHVRPVRLLGIRFARGTTGDRLSRG